MNFAFQLLLLLWPHWPKKQRRSAHSKANDDIQSAMPLPHSFVCMFTTQIIKANGIGYKFIWAKTTTQLYKIIKCWSIFHIWFPFFMCWWNFYRLTLLICFFAFAQLLHTRVVLHGCQRKNRNSWRQSKMKKKPCWFEPTVIFGVFLMCSVHFTHILRAI